MSPLGGTIDKLAFSTTPRCVGGTSSFSVNEAGYLASPRLVRCRRRRFPPSLCHFVAAASLQAGSCCGRTITPSSRPHSKKGCLALPPPHLSLTLFPIQSPTKTIAHTNITHTTLTYKRARAFW